MQVPRRGQDIGYGNVMGAKKTAQDSVIKFTCESIRTQPLQGAKIYALNALRDRLYARELIGVRPDGVGFGNVSIRVGKTNQFIITGSGTGRFPKLDGSHYTIVTAVDHEHNWLQCRGPIRASSESMTHYAVYAAMPSARAVIHVHAPTAWKRWVGKLPTTSRNAKYGTPDIAKSTLNLFSETDVGKRKAFVLGGHRPGLIVFGKTITEAERVLRKYVR